MTLPCRERTRPVRDRPPLRRACDPVLRPFPLRRSPLALVHGAMLLLATGASAQITASEAASTTQTISGTELEVAYSRPSLRGRGTPFGDIVAFDDTWTGGANRATTFRTSADIVLGGAPVPAGRYSVWLEVTDASEWRVMLHADTTLFHVPHPPIDSAQIVGIARRERGADVLETLAWRFDDVAWNGAVLTLAWGRERIRIPLEVDPGVTLSVSAEEAARYVGTWRIDDSGGRPPADRIEEALADPELGDDVRLYWEMMRDTPTERAIDIVWDSEEGRLYRTDPPFVQVWALFAGMGEGDPRFELLVPRAEGVFAPTMALGGELMSFNAEFADFMEFTAFDDDGTALAFEVRNGDDEVVMTGVRTGG